MGHLNACDRDNETLESGDIGPRSAIYKERKMAPQAGFEPATKRLTVACSTTELLGNVEDMCVAVLLNKCQFRMVRLN